MPNLIQADIFQLRRSTAMRVSLAVAVVAAVGYVYLARLMGDGTLSMSDANSASVFSDVMVVNLLGPLLAGIVVAQDFETKTVHDVLLSATRASFVATKTIVFAMVTVLLVAPYGVAAAVGLLSGQEFTAFLPTAFLSIVANETGAPVDGATIGRVVAITLVSGLLYAGRLAVCLPLAFAIKRPVAVMAIGFAWGFVADLLVGLVEDVPVLSDLVALTPYAASHSLTLESTGGDLLAAGVASVVFLALMAGAAHLVFRRADIK